MNWKRRALTVLLGKVVLFGATAGVWGTVLLESARLVTRGGADPTAASALEGAALGLALAVLLAPIDAVVHGHRWRGWRTAGSAVLAGPLLGALSGSLLAVADRTWPAPVWVLMGHEARWAAWLGLPVLLGAAGAATGLAHGLWVTHRRQWPGRMALGAAMGLVLGLPVGIVQVLSAAEPWVLLTALAGWGGALAVGLHWWARLRARCWLRLLVGPGEDSVFPLQGRSVTVGKHEANDVPLLRYQEVYPFHCELRWDGDHYTLSDNEQAGVVMVNYRQVQSHDLKPGDLIKVGSALLQYGEAS